jgi:DNA repair protein RadC
VRPARRSPGAIVAWPATERPRERLAARGAAALSEAELLALLLRSGSRGDSAVDLARRLQAIAQSQGGWDRLHPGQLSQLRGMGPAKAAAVLAAVEWSRRLVCKKEPRRKSLKGSADAWYYCKERLRERKKESFLVVALDARNRPLGEEIISVGTLTQSLVHPREVFSTLLRMSAAAFLVAHNHPSGDPKPSADDRVVTLRLKQCAEIFSIPLLDHLIVTDNQYHSFADHGWKGIKEFEHN